MTESEDRPLVSFDWAIKRLLRSKANFVVLEGFLSELLFDDIKIIEILESESNKDSDADKYNRVDIKVRNSKGEVIIVEVQFNDDLDFLHRITFGAAKTICEHLHEGDPYSGVIKVISVNIVYFDLGEGDDYIYHGKTSFTGIHKNDRLKLSQRQCDAFKKEYPSDIFPEFYIIKVNNFDDVAKSPLDEWMYLLKNSAVKESFTAKGIEEAKKALNIMNMTADERQAYDRHIDSVRVYNSNMRTAERNGEERGMIIFANLVKILTEQGRTEDIIKATTDINFRNKLIDELRLR